MKQWIKEKLFKQDKPVYVRLNEKYLLSNYPDKLQEITKETNFLYFNSPSKERIYCLLNDIKEQRLCKTCKKPVKWHSFVKGYFTYCSSKCANLNPDVREKFKQTNRKVRGVDNPFQCSECQEKSRQTIQSIYHVDNVAHSLIIQQQKEETCKKRLNGAPTPFHSPIIQDKAKETWRNTRGVDNPQKDPEVRVKTKNTIDLRTEEDKIAIKNKSIETQKEKFDRENISQIHISKEALEKLDDPLWLIDQHHNLKKSCTEIAEFLGIDYYSLVVSRLKKFNIELKNFGNSRFEKQIKEFINIENIKINTRSIISPYELDIYLPDQNLAIEFNGLYFHSYDRLETPEEKKYHLMKTKLCQQKGIQLLHIFENEWLDENKQDIWKSIISGKLNRNNKIFARKCQIKEINSQRQFLDENHLQGFTPSKVNLGLFYQNELVSLMSFSKSRFNNNYEWELTRYCSKKYHNIIGGASRLYKYFLDNYHPSSIISYSDLRYSNGNMYKQLDMNYLGNSSPNYYYFKNGTLDLHNRIKFQKHRLSELLENFNPELSESQNMFANRYRRIWDCGNMVFEYKKEI